MDSLALAVGISGAITTIIGSVAGACLGGRYVKEGVLLASKKDREAEETNERLEISNLRKALLAEIETLMVRYMEGIGTVLEQHPDETPFVYTFPLYQRYFVIFEENAHLIGKIPNDKERELIVHGYGLAKGLLDSYLFNNTMVEKLGYAVGLGPVVLGANYLPVANEIKRVMSVYTPVLKQMHKETIGIFNELRTSLKGELVWPDEA